MLKIIVFLTIALAVNAETSLEDEGGFGRYLIEGRVFPPFEIKDRENEDTNWWALTRIHVNGGEFIGFVKKDGGFFVHNIPSGSYIVEVLHPQYTFEPVRVEITSRGKFRARKLNNIQTSLVIQVPYPLKLKALGKTRYFQTREQWRITDFLFNPMVMMMLFPVLLIMILPRLMNDPDTKKDLEQIQKMTKYEMPQVSDVVSNFLTANTSQVVPKEKDGKKVQKPRKRPVARE
ncbi:ER membrane protein complex subunit 7 [Dendroctonus ponderosae]|uniref:ER membrane protein complex subunit 7 beta-sandwich domain-containing protein n=1 Tax=Dendroctonus ponderosae TaxID=77166 RepID=J3JWP2_DENPD